MGRLQYLAMVFLLGEMCIFAMGADIFTVKFESQKTCFKENKDISIVVEYTGAGTPDILQWKFSKMTDPTNALNIFIDPSCGFLGLADAAFPVTRMSYTCDDTTKKYTTTITGFTEASDAGTWEVALSVSGTFTNFSSVTVEKCSATTPAAFKFPQWLKAIIGVFLGLYCAGIIIVLILVKTRHFFCNCFYYWKPKCCCICEWILSCFDQKLKCWDRCVREICDSCENCNVKGLPFWYLILWLSVIGIPVALGILSGWIVYRICCKNAIRYVLITGEGTSINDDENWSLGASVGAYCVTKVTPRGPADGKLKVGDQMNKINGITLTGKNPNQMLTLLNNEENLTLDVSRVGIVSTTDSVVALKREQLGFEYEYIAMVTNVTEESKAEGKMEKGDLILSINGKSTAGKSNAEVNKKLKKPEVMELSIKGGKENETIKDDLKKKASLGITIIKEKEDIVVFAIEPESAAAISGEIQKKDIILSVNGVSTAGMKVEDIKLMLKFSIIRKVTKDVTLKELDPDKDWSFGFETFPTNSTHGPGNMVDTVTHDGPAQRHGIKHGDTIVSINGKKQKGKVIKKLKQCLRHLELPFLWKLRKVIQVDQYSSEALNPRTLTPLQDGHRKHNLLKKEPLADIQPNKTT